MSIQKLLQIVSLTLVLSCLAGCIEFSSKPTPAPTEELVLSTPLPERTTCNVLRVAGGEGWYPYYIRNETTNELEGIALDVVKQLSQDLDIPLEIVEGLPWKRVLLMTEQGDVDVVAGAYWNAERAEKYQYSIPFAQDEARVFVLKENQFPFEELSDLKGKVGGRPLGGSYGEEFDQYAKEHLTFEEVEGSKDKIFTKLLLERNDYAVYAYWDGMGYLWENDLDDQIVPLPKPVAINEIHLMLSRTSPCRELVDSIDELLEQYLEDGTIDAIMARYGNPD